MLSRFLFTPLFLCLGLSLATAQITIGLRAGVSTSSLNNETVSIGQDGIDDVALALEDARYGLHAGLLLRLPLGRRWLLQPEAIFNSNRADYTLEDFEQNQTFAFEESYQYIDIPVLVTYRLGPLRLLGGPVGNIFLNSTNDLEDFDALEEEFDNLTIGWAAGVGLDLGALLLDVRREGNFNQFGDHFRVGGRAFEFDQNPARWSFSIGYRF